jgi:nucleotide-binding universal stress UspA family protein
MNSPASLRTLLVHHDGSSDADDLIRLAFSAVAPGGRIVALAVTRVPPSLPLQGLPPEMDEPGRAALRRAWDVAWRSGREIELLLRRGRDLARVIVLEACRMDADAIVLALEPPRFPWLPLGLSRTARQVLRQAPCPVFLGYFPASGPLDSSRAIAEAERLLTRVR